MQTTFLELQLKSLFIMNFISGCLKVSNFPSMIIFQILHRLSLHMVTRYVVFSPNVKEVSILLRFLGCRWLLMIFFV